MKYLLRLASFLLFFGILSLICLRIPAVQTKIVNSFLQNYVGDTSQIESVNVGFLGSIHLKTILLEHPSARIRADALKLKISPLSILTKPHFSQVSGKGLQIKILASSENKEESIEIKDNDNLKFEGVLNTLLSFVNLEGCSLSLDALVELPLKQKIQCKISNKNKDSKNLFHDLTFDYHNPQPDCKLRRIQGSGDLQLKLSDNKEEQLKIRFNSKITDASNSEWVHQASAVGVVIKASEQGESYLVKVVSIHPSKQKKPILDLDATFNKEKQEIMGNLSLTSDYTSIAPYLAANNLPNFEVITTGKVRYSLLDQNTAVNLKIQGEVKELSRIRPSLDPIESIQINGALDADINNDQLTIHNLNLNLADDSSDWLNVNLQKKLVLHLNQNALNELSEQRGELLSVQLNNFNVALLDPFIPDIHLKSGTLHVDLGVGINEMGKPNFNSRVPFSMREIVFGYYLEGVEQLLQLDTSFELSGGLNRMRYSIPSFAISKNKKPLLSSSFSGNYNGLEKTATLSGSHEIAIENAIQISPIGNDLKLDLCAYLKNVESPYLLKNNLDLEFDFNRSFVSFETFSLELLNRYQKVLLRLNNRSKLSIGFDGVIDPLNLQTGELFSMKLLNLTTKGLDHFIPNVKMDSKPITGGFIMNRVGNEYLIKSSESLSMNGLQVYKNGQLLINDLDFKANPEVRFNQSLSRVKASTGSFKAFESGEALLLGRIEGNYNVNSIDALECSGKISILLPVLTRQPFLNAKQLLGTGELDLNWKFQGSKKWKGSAEIKLDQLRGREIIGNRLPQLVGNIIFEHYENQEGQIVIPVQIKGVADSDLEWSLNYKLDPLGNHSFESKANSKKIYIDDLLDLSNLFIPDSTGQNPAAKNKKTVSNSNSSPWGSTTGNMELNLDEITLPNRLKIKKTILKLKTTPMQIRLDHLSSQLEAAELISDGKLNYNDSQEKPFDYSMNIQLKNFDTEYLKGIPNAPNNFSGIFSTNSKIYGSSPNVEELGKNIAGNFKLTAKNGKFVMIDPDSKLVKLSTSLRKKFTGGTKLLQAGLGIASSLGTFKNESKFQEILSQDYESVFSLIESLKEPEFNEFRVSINKREGHDYEIESLQVLSPVINLEGNGKILDGPNIPFKDQRLMMNLNLFFDGELKLLMDKLSLVADNQNAIGYQQMKNMPVTIGGSIRKIDFSNFTNQIYNSIQKLLNEITPSGENLFNKFNSLIPESPTSSKKQNQLEKNSSQEENSIVDDVIQELPKLRNFLNF